MTMLKSLKRSLAATMKPAAQASKWCPHQYQKDSVRWLLSHAAAGLFADPGTGKTSITLAALKVLKKEGVLGKVLIIAPLRVCYMVWPAEIQKWSDFNGFTTEILHGSKKDIGLYKEADIYLINPDGLPWLMENNNFRRLGVERLVVDESSYFKHTNTRRFKLLKPALEKMRSRWILTGSPAPNGYLDLFGQVYIMDLGSSLGRYITHFKSTYFYPTGYGGYTWSLQPGADKRIQEKIKPLIKILDADELLELPEIVNSIIEVQLPKPARKVYTEMEILMLTELSGETITAASAAAASIKCRQIANGGLYKEDRENVAKQSDSWAHIHDEKAEAVKEIVQELQGQPVMVAYEFNHDLFRLKQALGKTVPHIGGGVSPRASNELTNAWNGGQLPVLLVHPQAVAHGLNLQSGPGNRIIFHSLIWNWEYYFQLIKRLQRQGSKHKRIFVDHIIAKDTIDEVMYKIVTKKGVTERGLMAGLKDWCETKRRSYHAAK